MMGAQESDRHEADKPLVGDYIKKRMNRWPGTFLSTHAVHICQLLTYKHMCLHDSPPAVPPTSQASPPQISGHHRRRSPPPIGGTCRHSAATAAAARRPHASTPASAMAFFVLASRIADIACQCKNYSAGTPHCAHIARSAATASSSHQRLAVFRLVAFLKTRSNCSFLQVGLDYILPVLYLPLTHFSEPKRVH